jgi:threonine synthase
VRPEESGVLRRYSDRLPIGPETPLITLGEGDTPLIRSRRLHERVGCRELYFKLEMCNPTGSFKDRGMVVAVAKALESDAKAVLCASTGNTSASAAAYAAHCGLDAYVLVPHGNIAQGKLAQAVAHGARILNVHGNFDDALRLARAISEKHPVALVNSVNPYRLEGQKTAAFEIVDALGDAPDMLFIPVGNAGNISAYWRGFVEDYQAERASKKPRMIGWQAEGAAPIVTGKPVENPRSVASAARDESGGQINAVSDDEILEAYRLLAQEEGIFCEPASAACVAGLLKHARTLGDQPSALGAQTIVCIITGHGLKDPDTALAIDSELLEVEPRIEAIEEAMGLA